MSVVTTERTWECACHDSNEHQIGVRRAWCSDCSEWCTPGSLCVRGEYAQLQLLVTAYEPVIKAARHACVSSRPTFEAFNDLRDAVDGLELWEDAQKVDRAHTE